MSKLPSWLLDHLPRPAHYSPGVGVDLSKKSLWTFVAMVAFNPIFWNTVARNEYRNKTITKTLRSPYLGCYLLAITIFSLSAFRDSLFLAALRDQPASTALSHPLIKPLAAALFASGQIFVISSMWALGVTGTYLGDYFGILMSHRVTGFPFNTLNDPMYVGSALSHLGTALWFQSPTGVILAAWVHIVYTIALRYEGPFTDMIYSAAYKKTDDAEINKPIRKSEQSTPTPTAKPTPNPTPDTTYADVASEPKSSNGLPSATPRKGRKHTYLTDSEDDRSDPTPRTGRVKTATEGTYADAAAEPRGEGGLPSVTPRKGRKSGWKVEGDTDSPMRMTRSRSKGRGLGSDVDTDKE